MAANQKQLQFVKDMSEALKEYAQEAAGQSSWAELLSARVKGRALKDHCKNLDDAEKNEFNNLVDELNRKKDDTDVITFGIKLLKQNSDNNEEINQIADQIQTLASALNDNYAMINKPDFAEYVTNEIQGLANKINLQIDKLSITEQQKAELKQTIEQQSQVVAKTAGSGTSYEDKVKVNQKTIKKYGTMALASLAVAVTGVVLFGAASNPFGFGVLALAGFAFIGVATYYGIKKLDKTDNNYSVKVSETTKEVRQCAASMMQKVADILMDTAKPAPQVPRI